MHGRSVLAAGLGVLFVSAAACGGGKSATAPSKSPTASPTISQSPSISPSPSVSPSPTVTIDVFGQIGFQVIVLEGGKKLKEPFDIILQLRSVETGEITPEFLEGNGNFTDSLEPGTYAVVNLQIQPPALGNEPVVLDTTGPKQKELRFTVPESGCVYVGRVVFTYVRLPKGNFDKQVKALSDFAPGEEAIFSFRPDGSMVYFPSDPGSHAISLPKKNSRVPEARPCSTDRLEYVDIL